MAALTAAPGASMLPAMNCDHHWVIQKDQIADGRTRSTYRCKLCRVVTRVCPMGNHPYGFPTFRDPHAYCAWCQTPNSFTEQ